MPRCWDPSIRGRWCKVVRFCLSLILCSGLVCAQSLETLARAYHKDPRPSSRAALLRYAAAHPKDANGALALLAAGVTDLENKEYAEALPRLKAAAGRLPMLADYTAYFVAQAELHGEGALAGDAGRGVEREPEVCVAVALRIVAAQADVRDNEPRKALELLKQWYPDIAQPAGDLMMANAFEKAADLANAVTYCQRVYYGYPTSLEAEQAAAAMGRLRPQLGDDYPPAMPQQMLSRALKLLDARDYGKARKELLALVPSLGGQERELAQVRVGAADYLARETPRAYQYLKDLDLSSQEADAERLYYQLASARRMNNQDEVSHLLDRLARVYPRSKWRLEALLVAGNHYLLLNQVEGYEPLYRACYESFPDDRQAAYCHWKVAWGEYLRRRPDAAEMMRAHLRSYPKSEKAGAALYFLGRLAEDARDAGSARAYYEEIDRFYPNSYYAMLARRRLEQATIARAALTASTKEFLAAIEFPPRAHTIDFTPNAATQRRIERARMLSSAGLDDWAEGELRFGARNGDQPHLLAMELAEIAKRRSEPDQGIRYIKSLTPDYLFLPMDTAPEAFWRLAFPLPYKADLERYSRERSLDPYLVAALIRQESEFNPKAISPAKAYGLTQILPSTGRELSRRLKVRPYSTKMLFQPAVNLKLGTFYLRSLLDQMSGRWEATLASYNAGKTRAVAWLNWGEFREPAEFVETIPFTQTRDYVQIVLRNADVYRRLYGSTATTVAQQE